ncbi:MAG: four helix bundle suffix domain-containing protein [Alistipes sp.]|nr:four helix bundle suffix domain-containing protein [Alistipes sp.]
MAIVLIYQADTLIMRYIKSVEDDFMQHGGVKERLYKLRTEANNN